MSKYLKNNFFPSIGNIYKAHRRIILYIIYLFICLLNAVPYKNISLSEMRNKTEIVYSAFSKVNEDFAGECIRNVNSFRYAWIYNYLFIYIMFENGYNKRFVRWSWEIYLFISWNPDKLDERGYIQLMYLLKQFIYFKVCVWFL